MIRLDLLTGRNYGIYPVITNLVVQENTTGVQDGAVAEIGFLGDGTHTLDLSAFYKYDVNGADYDNTADMLNVFAFFRWLGRSYWVIVDQYTYTGPVTLAAPGSFAANSGSISSITLTWTTVANASSYMLEWSPNGTSGWTQIGGTLSQPTTTYNHTGLTSGVQYFYRISSIGDGVNYLTSGYATANDTVNTPVTLSAPTVTPSQLDSNTARFTITPVANASGYRYRYGTTSGVYGAENNTGSTTVDIDATTGQTVYAIFMTVGDGVSYLNSAYGSEVSQLLSANQAPVASSVNITGSTTLGATLTGNYTYSDNEGDLQGTSTFRWLRNDVAIGGATNSTYIITLADQGTTIKFEVTPVAQTGTTPGTPVQSVGTAIPANAAPVLTAGSFTGTPQDGQVLTGSLGSYSDADGDLAGTHTYQWYRDTNNSGYDGTPIGGATSLNYTVVTADVGNYLYRADTPVALTGTTPGTPVNTAYSTIVIAASSYEAEYTAVYNRMVALGYTPNTTDADRQNTLVASLKSSGAWAKLDALYILAIGSNTGNAHLIDWVNPASRSAVHNGVAPTFTAYEGLLLTNSSSSTRSGYNPTTETTPNYTQNSAFYAYYFRTNSNVSSQVGVVDIPAAEVRSWLYPRASGNSISNINSTSNLTIAVADSLGMYVVNRVGSGAHSLIKNNTVVGTSSAVSNGVPNEEFAVCGFNNNGTWAANGALDRQTSMFAVGGGLIQAEWEGLTNAFETYMDAYGKGVV